MHRKGFIYIILIVATLAAYGSLPGNDFVNFDDPMYVLENPGVTSGVTGESLTWALTTTHMANWHPLTWLSHMLDYHIFGDDPGGHHWSSLLLHLANTLMLFGWLRRATASDWKSVAVAIIFALHPLHVESVAWVAERKDVLSTFFGFLCLRLYTGYAEKPSAGGYWGTITVFALGLTAKPMLVTLPFLLLLLDYWPLGRSAWQAPARSGQPHAPLSTGRLVIEKIPFFALAGLASVVTLVAQSTGGAVGSLVKYPFGVRLANAVVAYTGYLSSAAFPFDLAFYYPHPGVVPLGRVAGAFLVLLVVTLATVRVRRTRPMMLVGWLWYLGMLVPVIGIVQVGNQAMADRYMYMPLVGVSIMVVWGVAALLPPRGHWVRTACFGFFMAGAVCLGLLTWRQVGFWKNSVTLFDRALQVTADNDVALNGMGYTLSQQGRDEAAIAFFEAALNIRPDYTDALYNLARSLRRVGRSQDALARYRDVLAQNPDDYETCNNIGNILATQGRLHEALMYYRRSLDINPDYEIARENLLKVVRAAKRGQ